MLDRRSGKIGERLIERHGVADRRYAIDLITKRPVETTIPKAADNEVDLAVVQPL